MVLSLGQEEAAGLGRRAAGREGEGVAQGGEGPGVGTARPRRVVWRSPIFSARSLLSW